MTQAGSRPAPRVLWLAKGLGRGGMERLISSIVPRLCDRGHFAVEVAYALPWKDAFVPELRDRGVPVHCLGASRSADPSWTWRLAALLRRQRYHLVHSHSPVPAVAARTLARRGRPRLVYTEHNVWERYRWPTYAANAATFSRNDAVFSVSRGVSDSIRPPRWLLRARFPQVEILHHGIDPAAVRSGPRHRDLGRARLGLAADDRVLGTVANFTPKKDHLGLLKAFAELARRYDRLRLVLVGTGPLEHELRARARQLGLDGQVLFTGMRDDVAEILPAFDVFVLGSRHEGLSIALIEAMAAGVPCVATRVGGVPEVVQGPEEGILVPSHDPHALAGAIAGLLDDAGLRRRIADRGAARALTSFTIDRAVGRIEERYWSLLGRR